MSRKSSIITTSVLSLVLSAAAFAHEGFDHVMGTVVTSSNNVLTVKTAKGNVDVRLDAKTELTKGTAKALPADLKPGVRVVVDIPEDSKDKVAHSVKIGAAAPAAAEHHHE